MGHSPTGVRIAVLVRMRIDRNAELLLPGSRLNRSVCSLCFMSLTIMLGRGHNCYYFVGPWTASSLGFRPGRCDRCRALRHRAREVTSSTRNGSYLLRKGRCWQRLCRRAVSFALESLSLHCTSCPVVVRHHTARNSAG